MVINFSILLGCPVFAAKVNVVHGWPAQQGEAFEKIVNAFMVKHPDIEVIVEVCRAGPPGLFSHPTGGG